MDDTLEIPRPRSENLQEGDDHSSGDEDGGLDWTKLPKLGAAARPIIPKRGEKDFEPTQGGGSGLQLHVLDRSRGAMFDALRTNRTISSKTISYGIWYPSIDRVHVTSARGIHFSTMGHSVSRTVQRDDTASQSDGSSSKPPKRLELLPEEALYLIERGALFCYKSISDISSFSDPLTFETKSPGGPMSVQQAFAEMIGREEMTLERYQVYAYLKRLGFILMRAEPTTSECSVASLISFPPTGPTGTLRRLTEFISRLASRVLNAAQIFHRFDWWRPLQPHRQKTAHHIFKALRFIPCGHRTPLHHSVAKSEYCSKSSEPSPYKIFFHAYKPSTPFRKTAPPAPDFYVVVVDARTTSVPTLQELTALFEILPEMPLPPPRKRGNQAHTKQSGDPRPTEIHSTAQRVAPRGGSPGQTGPLVQSWSCSLGAFFRHLLSLFPSFRPVAPPPAKPAFTPPRPNPFLALKTGKKTVVIAAVDAGNISFFRFGQGVFEEWPMT